MNAKHDDIDLSNIIKPDHLTDWSKSLSETELKDAQSRAAEALRALELSEDANDVEIAEQERLVYAIDSEIQKRDAEMQIQGERPDLIKQHHDAQDKLKAVNQKLEDGREMRAEYLKRGDYMQAAEDFMKTEDLRQAAAAAEKEVIAARANLNAAIDARAASNDKKDLNPKLDAESLRKEQAKLKSMSSSESEKYLSELSAKHLTALKDSAADDLKKMRELTPNAQEAIKDQKYLVDALETEAVRRTQHESKEATESKIEADEKQTAQQEVGLDELKQEHARLDKRSNEAYSKWSAANSSVKKGGLTDEALAEAKSREQAYFNECSEIEDRKQEVRGKIDALETEAVRLAQPESKEATEKVEADEKQTVQQEVSLNELKQEQARLNQRGDEAYSKWSAANSSVKKGGLTDEALAEAKSREQAYFKEYNDIQHRKQEVREKIDASKAPDPALKENRKQDAASLIDRIRNGRQDQRDGHLVADEQLKDIKQVEVEQLAVAREALKKDIANIESRENLIQKIDAIADKRAEEIKVSVGSSRLELNKKVNDWIDRIRTGQRDENRAQNLDEAKSAANAEKPQAYERHPDDKKIEDLREQMKSVASANSRYAEVSAKHTDAMLNYAGNDPAKQLHSALIKERQFDYKERVIETRLNGRQSEQLGANEIKALNKERANLSIDRAENQKQIDTLAYKHDAAEAKVSKQEAAAPSHAASVDEKAEAKKQDVAAVAVAKEEPTKMAESSKNVEKVAVQKQESVKTPQQALNERLARNSAENAAANTKEGKTVPSERTIESAERVSEKVAQVKVETKRLEEANGKDENRSLAT